MSLKVQFGTGGHKDLDTLIGDLAQSVDALNTGPLDETAGDLPDLNVKEITPVASTGQLHSAPGGDVDIIAYSTTPGQTTYAFDVAGDWNTVKNFYATSEEVAYLHVKDFVHVDIDIRDDTHFLSPGSRIQIDNVKRGNVTTGSGNDEITISLLSNDEGWVNTFSVYSGTGNDRIIFNSGNISNAGETDNDKNWIAGASGTKAVTDGSYTDLFIDAGAGYDFIDLRAVNPKSTTIIGGGGDQIYLSGGSSKDTIIVNPGEALQNYAGVQIWGFKLAEDTLKLHGNAEDWEITSGYHLYNQSTNDRVSFHNLQWQNSFEQAEGRPDWIVYTG